MLDLKIGKGGRVIWSSSAYYTLLCIAAYPGREGRYPTLLLMGTMARGVCALKSCSYYMCVCAKVIRLTLHVPVVITPYQAVLPN